MQTNVLFKRSYIQCNHLKMQLKVSGKVERGKEPRKVQLVSLQKCTNTKQETFLYLEERKKYEIAICLGTFNCTYVIILEYDIQEEGYNRPSSPTSHSPQHTKKSNLYQSVFPRVYMCV